MPAEQLDEAKVKEFVTKQLKDFTEPKQVEFRKLNKEIAKEFGKGLFLPALSSLVRSVRSDLSKPPRNAGARHGRKPGPKPGARRGRPPGRRGPGRPPGSRGPRRRPGRAPSSGKFLVQVGRDLIVVNSRERLEAVVHQHGANGAGLKRLRVFSMSPIELTTEIVIG